MTPPNSSPFGTVDSSQILSTNAVSADQPSDTSNNMDVDSPSLSSLDSGGLMASTNRSTEYSSLSPAQSSTSTTTDNLSTLSSFHSKFQHSTTRVADIPNSSALGALGSDATTVSTSLPSPELSPDPVGVTTDVVSPKLSKHSTESVSLTRCLSKQPYVMLWSNIDALCWLDVLLALLCHNKSVRTVLEGLPYSSVIKKLLLAYDESQALIAPLQAEGKSLLHSVLTDDKLSVKRGEDTYMKCCTFCK